MSDRRRWFSPGCRPVPDPYIEVGVDGLLLEHDHAYNPFKIGYMLNGWRGWREGPEVKSNALSWDDADGGLLESPLFGGRNLELSGVMRARDEQHLHQMMERMGAVLTRPRKGPLLVREQLLKLERTIEVKRGGRPVMTQVLPDMATWSIQFEAADYRRLSVTSQTVTVPIAGIDLRNLGNDDAAVSAQLTGPLDSNIGIGWPGGAWRYGIAVPAGTTILVDFEERIVRNPATTGHSRGEVGGAGDWISLPPGTTRVSRLGGGNGSFRLTWRHTWS